MGGSKWMKLKTALGLNLTSCLYGPRTVEDSPVAPPPDAAADALSPTPPRDSDRHRVRMPTTPTPSSSGLQLPKHSSKSCKSICAICLATMKPGHGHAIFTAECSHAFHFHCITSNVKHGKQICPVCRAIWKEIPFQRHKSHPKPQMNNVPWPQIPSPREATRNSTTNEPNIFDDDDEITPHQSNAMESSSSRGNAGGNVVEVQMYPEVSAVPKSISHENFSILVHLKAPSATKLQDCDGVPFISQSSRAAVDLVTVLDVSGSMAGTKLALLKRAMGFVIQNLGPSDRLSVIAFSSTARRLFPLRRMTNIGRYEALQAVNSLTSNGGTNIAEGLRKGAKVIGDRKWKNPVSSIILLSDGQDTYTVNAPIIGAKNPSSSQSLLPDSMQIPIHAFGFGVDHDALSMHSISEASGGTFSFIEAESMIQDAFAQCIGGLLSVVVQDMKVEVECVDPISRLVSVKSGSYKKVLALDNKRGSILVGDLYAEEERDFLVTIDVPVYEFSEEMSLVRVKCSYKHPITKTAVTVGTFDVKIERPMVAGQVVVALEVEKQWNRMRTAEAMVEAKTAAEQGDLASAVTVLEKCRKRLLETMSGRLGDRLYVGLDAELREMQERMANRQVYESSGRAYVLSGLSSHSWQRATARGDSTESTSLVQAYQTPSMVDMVNLSHTMVLGKPAPLRRTIRPAMSYPARSEQRR